MTAARISASYGRKSITHCFSVDVEGFCQSMAESFLFSPDLIGTDQERREIEENVLHVLDFLSQWEVRATFFCLGVIGEQQPKLLRRIAEAGHEIGSHSYQHLRLNGQDRKEAREAILRSRKALQDACGQEVAGFRAPDFSITRDTTYLLDFIEEAGYLYDSSIYPISLHDVYGIGGSPRGIHMITDHLVEFPLTTWRVAFQTLPALGGGYFRLYPLALSDWILRSFDREGAPAMFYIHPYELGPNCPRLEGLSWFRRFRHYFHIEKCEVRCTELFKKYRFGTAIDVIRSAGFVTATGAEA